MSTCFHVAGSILQASMSLIVMLLLFKILANLSLCRKLWTDDPVVMNPTKRTGLSFPTDVNM